MKLLSYAVRQPHATEATTWTLKLPLKHLWGASGAVVEGAQLWEPELGEGLGKQAEQRERQMNFHHDKTFKKEKKEKKEKEKECRE